MPKFFNFIWLARDIDIIGGIPNRIRLTLRNENVFGDRHFCLAVKGKNNIISKNMHISESTEIDLRWLKNFNSYNTIIISPNNVISLFDDDVVDKIVSFPVVFMSSGQLSYHIQDTNFLAPSGRRRIRYSKILVLSELDRLNYAQFGIHNARVIHNPIERRKKNKYSIKNNKFAGYVGRIDFHARGCDRLIGIIRSFSETQYAPFKIKTPSKELAASPDFDRFMNLLHDSGQFKNVEFVFDETDPEKLFGDLALSIFPSRKESFGNAILESLSMGVPVISSSYAPGPRELINHGVNGFLVDNYTGPVLEEIIGNLSSETLVNMSQEAFATHFKFSFDRYFQDLHDIAAEVTQSPHGNVYSSFPKMRVLDEFLKNETVEEKPSSSKLALAKANAEIARLRSSFWYKLGYTITFHAKSPTGWLRMPFSVAKLLFKTLRDRFKGRSVSAVSHAPLVGLGEIKPGRVLEMRDDIPVSAKRNVYKAYQISIKDGWEVGSIMLGKSKFESDRRVANLFQANRNRDSDKTWSIHLNRYLAHYGLHPIFLDEGSAPLFNRLNCDPGYKMQGETKVSILMPAYNAEKTIETAIRSILSQTWTNLELIVVDDNSTDDTAEIVRELCKSDKRLRLIENRINVGPYVAKNIALQQADGDYITGHDSDDWAHPQRLEFQMKIMLAQSHLQASICHMLRVRADGEFFEFLAIGPRSTDGAARLASISCIFKASILRDKLGYWDSVRFGADSEMIERARTLLGEKFQTLNLISMICLNNEKSLTNDPVHGIRAGDDGNLSPARLSYRDAWKKWHKTLKEEDSYISFPPQDRKFGAPTEMLVSPDVIQELVS